MKQARLIGILCGGYMCLLYFQRTEAALGTACTTANENTVCDVPGSACISEECACKPGYKTETTSCTKIALGDSCAAEADCSLIENAICETDCKCKSGFTENNGQCSHAAPVYVSNALLCLCLLAAALRRMF